MRELSNVRAVLLSLWCVLVVRVAAIPASAAVADQTLPGARKGFVSAPRACAYQPDPPVPQPPPGTYSVIRYRSPAGDLVALLTPDPKDGKKHPAVLWAHGGFGGIGEYYWSAQPSTNDQTPKAFLDAGFVVMLPAWRGENDNPGRYEMFLGEVDDALAVIEHLRGLSYVDPNRIYMVGHSTGGTMALLTALSTDKLRAAFSFGGSCDCRALVGSWDNVFPFDPANERELNLRSAIDFIPTLKTPTWYFEGERSGHVDSARAMKARANAAGAPLTTQFIAGGDHFDILRPTTKLLAEKLLRDTGPKLDVQIRPEEVQAAFEVENRARIEKLRGMPIVTLKPACVSAIKKVMAEQRLAASKTWLTVADGKLDLSERFDPTTQIEVVQDGIRIAVPKAEAERTRGLVIDFSDGPEGRGFVFRRGED